MLCWNEILLLLRWSRGRFRLTLRNEELNQQINFPQISLFRIICFYIALEIEVAHQSFYFGVEAFAGVLLEFLLLMGTLQLLLQFLELLLIYVFSEGFRRALIFAPLHGQLQFFFLIELC